ncbi:2-aminoethylphosphonate ABC transporter substrate-binding protein [Paenibacillus lycopersici]|uniref:2-aminoethylphosphonate ABC transporter substrate-binding protein n=1 Tax=Paenibacillus lycopersici TaxID=2704462 RepID=A0A6C0FNT5_9BACL|nr:2-aminoethylphosphonate ABC transporter substrate-binding protein [Paenibacillus lycopersici]QHT58547.1 2-aminoethylphosphonate ABC transporter substrate-binding protein [Paenibacillus lycopersici]
MQTKSKTLLLGTLAGLTVIASACGQAGNNANGADNAASGSGSNTKSSSTVTLYTADGLEDYYKEVLPAFEAANGVKVNMVADGSGAIMNRMTIEKDSPKADVTVILPPFIQQAQQASLLQAYKSTEDAAIPDARKDKDGYWTAFMNNYINFAYNPDLTKTPPATFNDLLTADYKDGVAYSNPITAGDGMAVLIMLEKMLGEDGAFTYLKKLEQNVKFHTKGTGYLDVLINRGEIKVANGDLQMDMQDKTGGNMSLEPLFLKATNDGQPVTFEDPYAIGLVKGGPNAETGKKLIDYLLSKDAQEKTYDIYGMSVRSDVTGSGEKADAIQKELEGVQVLDIDWNHVIEKQKAWQDKWQAEVLHAYNKQGDVVAPK